MTLHERVKLYLTDHDYPHRDADETAAALIEMITADTISTMVDTPSNWEWLGRMIRLQRKLNKQ